MRVLYIAFLDAEKSSGVNKKVIAQCQAMSKLGHEIRLLNISHEDCLVDYSIINFTSMQKQTLFSLLYFSKVQMINNVFGKVYRLFCPPPAVVAKEIQKFCPDIIYQRHNVVSPKNIAFLKKIKKAAKLYYEFYTYPYIKDMLQYHNLSTYIALLFEFRSIERLRKVVDEFVVVAKVDDIKAMQRLGKYRVIPNGFDVSSVKIRKQPALDKEVCILGFANLASHHGYDRVIKGMAKYTGPYKIVFHLAGGYGYKEIDKLKKLASDLKVTNVVFYPPLQGKDIDDLFDQCHIAAGSLGLHRMGVHFGSILKLREYCARGIPFFYATADADFKGCDFSMQLESNDDAIDMTKVCAFVEEMYEIPNLTFLIRRYAEARLTWLCKMQLLFKEGAI